MKVDTTRESVVATLVCNVELEPRKIIEQIVREYEYESVLDVTYDDLYEYICNHIPFLKGCSYNGKSAVGIKEVGDGVSLHSLSDRTMEIFDAYLDDMKKELEGEVVETKPGKNIYRGVVRELGKFEGRDGLMYENYIGEDQDVVILADTEEEAEKILRTHFDEYYELYEFDVYGDTEVPYEVFEKVYKEHLDVIGDISKIEIGDDGIGMDEYGDSCELWDYIEEYMESMQRG